MSLFEISSLSQPYSNGKHLQVCVSSLTRLSSQLELSKFPLNILVSVTAIDQMTNNYVKITGKFISFRFLARIDGDMQTFSRYAVMRAGEIADITLVNSLMDLVHLEARYFVVFPVGVRR